jgi:hypothetical protein
MAIEILGGYSDGYIANTNNFYLYQYPDSGQYLYIAADLDLCLGSTIQNITNMWSGNYSTFPGWNTRPLVNQIMRVPEFNQKFKQSLQELNTKLFSLDVVNPRINDLVNMLREDIAWDNELNDGLIKSFFSNMGLFNGTNGLSAPGLTKLAEANPIPLDMAKRMLNRVPLDVAVNGPTGHISLSGLKEWFSVIHQNTTNFFLQQ